MNKRKIKGMWSDLLGSVTVYIASVWVYCYLF